VRGRSRSESFPDHSNEHGLADTTGSAGTDGGRAGNGAYGGAAADNPEPGGAGGAGGAGNQGTISGAVLTGGNGGAAGGADHGEITGAADITANPGTAGGPACANGPDDNPGRRRMSRPLELISALPAHGRSRLVVAWNTGMGTWHEASSVLVVGLSAGGWLVTWTVIGPGEIAMISLTFAAFPLADPPLARLPTARCVLGQRGKDELSPTFRHNR
jgi:hypothetical protein